MYSATSADASARFLSICFLIRSFFKLLKKDSTTAFPAVPRPAHARLPVIRAAKTPPRVAAGRRTLIRMNHRATRPSPVQGHQDRVEHEFAVHVRPCRPADDLLGKAIHDNRQVEPS